MHDEARAFVASVVKRYAPRSPTLEIGGRNINGTIRDLFPVPYVSIDLVPGPGVDLVGDAARIPWPFAPRTVVCCEVLEHTAEAEALIRRIGESLAPGGWVILTCATVGRQPHSAADGGLLRPGEYYRNHLAAELLDWLVAAGITPIETVVDPGRGDLYMAGGSPPF